MQMLRSFSPSAFAFGLASWSWLGTHGKTPRFTTVFGDVFLESLDGWWLLDTIEGTLTLRWTNIVDLYAELDSDEGREEILLEDILVEVLDRGVLLRDDEVLAFVPHPAAGGRLAAESCSPLRFELALSLAGQVHGALLAQARPAPSPMLWDPQPEPAAQAWPAPSAPALSAPAPSAPAPSALAPAAAAPATPAPFWHPVQR
ncbi:hypothetical protein [Xylanimonas protaetiae]|uniref:hypothetical protein n=1 Tax=Xylanimonas protaetiae TaxID=2509457 RepID=UPI001A9129CF|nr:hypothetical protein [Xylanimonas protaetiae]